MSLNDSKLNDNQFIEERSRASSQNSNLSDDDLSMIKFDLGESIQICKGIRLGFSESGHNVYNGFDLTIGTSAIILEWIFSSGLEYNDFPPRHSLSKHKEVDLRQVLTELEKEMVNLIELYHMNLVRYLNMKIEEEDDVITVNVLQEFIPGVTLSTFLFNGHITPNFGMLQHLAKGLLEAVNYLHENNVVHGDIQLSNIFMDNEGNIRLTNYSVVKRLSNFCFDDYDGNEYSKEGDIFRIGTVLLSLWNGKIVTDDRVDLSIDLPPDFKDFISRCVDENEEARWSSEQLLNHQFFKFPMTKTSTNEIRDNYNSTNRLNKDYELLGKIGEGAFGDVLKYQNKLDHRYYAIKKIKIDSTDEYYNIKMIKEVRLLSMLEHRNVVRYYASWTENDTAETNSEQIQHLYIQMEFCEKKTLRDVIDNNLYQDERKIYRLFCEILDGLNYIHNQKIIHRDLKPLNIFLDTFQHAKIGDFGLATHFVSKKNRSSNLTLNSKLLVPVDSRASSFSNGSMTAPIGTSAYMAPELVKSSGRASYSTKVDVYSLGIILFEMCYMPLNTGMERAITLENLRHKDVELPKDFNFPKKFANVVDIRCLLNHNANLRPKTAQILNLIRKPLASPTVAYATNSNRIPSEIPEIPAKKPAGPYHRRARIAKFQQMKQQNEQKKNNKTLATTIKE